MHYMVRKHEDKVKAAQRPGGKRERRDEIRRRRSFPAGAVTKNKINPRPLVIPLRAFGNDVEGSFEVGQLPQMGPTIEGTNDEPHRKTSSDKSWGSDPAVRFLRPVREFDGFFGFFGAPDVYNQVTG